VLGLLLLALVAVVVGLKTGLTRRVQRDWAQSEPRLNRLAFATLIVLILALVAGAFRPADGDDGTALFRRGDGAEHPVRFRRHGELRRRRRSSGRAPIPRRFWARSTPSRRF